MERLKKLEIKMFLHTKTVFDIKCRLGRDYALNQVKSEKDMHKLYEYFDEHDSIKKELKQLQKKRQNDS